MQTVLLDTDYVIDFLRGKSKIIIPLIQEGSAYLSILSVYELFAGMRQEETRATEDFIKACHIEAVTIEIAKKAGAYRLTHRQNGLTLSIVDCIIAETARLHHHHIATGNKKHYLNCHFWPH